MNAAIECSELVSCVGGHDTGNKACALKYASIYNYDILDPHIPDQSEWPSSLQYTLLYNSSDNAPHNIKQESLPQNTSIDLFCPIRTKYNADYFWSLCPPPPSNGGTDTLICNDIIMYILKQAEECIQYRESYIQAADSQSNQRTLKQVGFWSSRCRCFSLITRMIELFRIDPNWQYCTEQEKTSWINDFYTLYSSSRFDIPIRTSPWQYIFDGVNELIDTMISKEPSLQSQIEQYKTIYPYYTQFLVVEAWHCYDDISKDDSQSSKPSLYGQDLYQGDSYPHLSQDASYNNNLFWAIPPNHAFHIEVNQPASNTPKSNAATVNSNVSMTYLPLLLYGLLLCILL